MLDQSRSLRTPVSIPAPRTRTRKLAGTTIFAALYTVASLCFAGAVQAQSPDNQPPLIGGTDATGAAAVSALGSIGINFGQGSWAPQTIPGTYNVDYTYATAAHYDYYKSKGFKVVRIAFLWERLQRSLYGSFDSAELSRIKGQVDLATQRGMTALLDPHNYARYNGNLIGSSAVPYAAFADLWRKLATTFKGYGSVAYGLMNEPKKTTGLWYGAVQPAIDAIRGVDMAHPILVPGEQWTNCKAWADVNGTKFDNLRDPANNFGFECHDYFDGDHSGTYLNSYSSYYASTAYASNPRQIARDWLNPFVNWLKSYRTRTGKNVFAFVGELGIPDNDEGWERTTDSGYRPEYGESSNRYLSTLDEALKILRANGIGATYWVGGPWDSKDALNTDPRDSLTNGTDRPQMTILRSNILAQAEALPLPAGMKPRAFIPAVHR